MGRRMSLPVRVGLAFGLAAVILVLIGVVRGNVPMNPASIVVALLIGAVSWFVVAWAVTMAAVDVEEDAAKADGRKDHEASSQP